MLQKVGKVLGFATHLLSFALVCCFCFLFVYFTDYTLFTLIPAHRSPTTQSWIFYTLLTILILYLALNIFFNYFMTMLTNPGTPTQNDSPNLLMVSKTCSKCHLPKPERTHHCSLCNRCVFQMDHHCPWMWNCVGHYNRRYFVAFLTTVSIQLLIIWTLNLTVGGVVREKNQFVHMFDVVMGVVFVVLTCFAIFHWYLIFKGKTSLQLCTNEDYLKSWTLMQRFELVFGSQSLYMVFVPNFVKLQNDGIIWQRNIDVY